MGGWGDSFTLSSVEPMDGSCVCPVTVAPRSVQSVPRDGMPSEGLPANEDDLVMVGLDGDVKEALRSSVLRDLAS